MEKNLTDERIGITYELVGDYYLIAGDKEPEIEIGVCGQRQPKNMIYSKRQLLLSFAIIWLSHCDGENDAGGGEHETLPAAVDAFT